VSAVFDISFTELLMLGTVALLVLGPEKLPGTLRLMGQWVAKVRRFTVDVRHQSGVDEALRAEGVAGGLSEMRSMMRGGSVLAHQPPSRVSNPDPFVPDKSREYPTEGADAYGALPEDLVAHGPPTSIPTMSPAATSEPKGSVAAAANE
jgi:sec-independent protein translocase protein TatB